MSYSTTDYVPMATAVPVPAPTVPMKSHKETVSTNNETNSLLQRRPRPLDENQVQCLVEQGFTRGLGTSLNHMMEVFALRIWIIDNSGSMQKPDGHRIIPNKNREVVKMVPCSRWEEIVECVDYHIELAGLIEAPTRFRLLNNPGANVGPQQFSVAEDPDRIMDDAHEASSIIRRARPGGCTPLTSHILEIHKEVFQMAPELRRLGKKVVMVIATDGLPTDERGYGGPQHNQEFVEALRLLEGLPIWVVVRLCTDDDEVVQFYNDLDGQLELSLEVLDDFVGEAKEVTGENPWLNYALPLHRLREMGYHDRVFDMLDERPLTKTEIRDFCSLLFGEENFDGVPDPALDWKGFMNDMERLLRKEAKQYDPVKKKAHAWMSMKKLNQTHGQSGCFIM
jgi:hypothetical protein